MQVYWLIGLVAIGATGCTSQQLQRSTVNQAGTLTDLQFQQVLDNLAMFASNRSAIPWQVTLKNGSSQVADSASASLVGAFGQMTGRLATGTPGAVGSRTIVEQWGTAPITDDTELRLLQIAYRRAFGSPETLDADQFADDLAHELKKQVSVTDDFKPLYDNLYKDPKMLAQVTEIARELSALGISRTEFDILNALILATNDDRIVQPGETVGSSDFESNRTRVFRLSELLAIKPGEMPRLPSTADDPTAIEVRKRATPVIQEVRRLLKSTEDDLESIPAFWFGVGCRKQDVPKDACYVGHYQDRCGERYVWVCADQREALAKFTLTILSLSSLIEDRQLFTVPGGPAYAPASAYTR